MIPKKIKILGHQYSVISDDAYIVNSGGNTGKSNSYTNQIYVCGSLPESAQSEVLIHEIIEAINYRLELNLEHPAICALGEVLNQVLQDNRIYREASSEQQQRL